jgi:hypothetical protein
VALLFPAQGEWSEDDSLWLTDHTRRLVEFTDGHIEVLPMPTDAHRRIVLCLYRALYAFLAAQGIGIVLVAPLRLRVRAGRYRAPDLLLLVSANDTRRSHRFWTGTDLVLEVFSPDDPKRDLVRKRWECARAGIPEYASPATRAQRLSIIGYPAVGVNGLASDKAAVITDQKQAGVGDFLYGPLPLQGNAGGVWRPPLIPFRVGTRGIDAAGGNHVDPDVVRGKLRG